MPLVPPVWVVAASSPRRGSRCHGPEASQICLADRREEVDVFCEGIDYGTVCLGAVWVADNAQNMIARLQETELLNEAVIGELLAVVRGDDDERVVPHAEAAQRFPHAAELVVDFAHHAVILRDQLALRVLCARRCRQRVLHDGVEKRVSFRRRRNRPRHLLGL